MRTLGQVPVDHKLRSTSEQKLTSANRNLLLLESSGIAPIKPRAGGGIWYNSFAGVIPTSAPQQSAEGRFAPFHAGCPPLKEVRFLVSKQRNECPFVHFFEGLGCHCQAIEGCRLEAF